METKTWLLKPSLHKSKTKIIIASLITILGISIMSPAFAISQQEAQGQISQINQQIDGLNKALADNQNKQQSIQDEIETINTQIQKIQLEITATQDQITVTNSQIDDTNAQINKTNEDLEVQKKIMGEYLKTMYMNGQTSMAELIVESNNFSDFVDKSEYLNTMQQKIKETEDKIAALKGQLDAKKKELDDEQAKNIQLKASQEAQQAAVIQQKNYQDTLLAEAKTQANSLSDQKEALYNKKAQLSTVFNETVNAVGPSGSSSYPYGNPPAANKIDTPDAYGYLVGECTSYAAWKRASVGRTVPRNLGNGGQWGANAAAQGMSVNSTPRVGDVMVFPYIGGYGHVAYVEAVNSNGTVTISEYNWTPYKYDQRTVNPYNYSAVFIH